MKIIDNNGRLFGKISVVDVIVLLVAVFLAAALYLKNNTMPLTSTAAAGETITYTVICNAMPEFVQDSLRVGDKLFDEDNLDVGSLGEIIDIQYLPGDELTEFDNGVVLLAPVEESVNVLLTVRATGAVTEEGYMINRVYPLGVNANRNLCTHYTHLRGIIASIVK